MAEYTVQSVSVDAIPSSDILFSSLTTVTGGSLPSFATAPVVSIRERDTSRPLYIDPADVTTTKFNVRAWDDFTDDPPYVVTVQITSISVSEAAASNAEGVYFAGYCSIGDVKDVLLAFDPSFGSSGKLDDRLLRRFIVSAYGMLNGALAKGSYVVPARNSVVQAISGALSAPNSAVNINSVEDGSQFTVGDWVRIHGANSGSYKDEFTQIVAKSSNVLTAEFLANSYDADATIERVLPGMDALRHLNAQGAALLATGALTIGYADATNDKEQNLNDAFSQGLKDIQGGKLRLTGITKVLPKSYITETSTSLYNSGDSVFPDSMRW